MSSVPLPVEHTIIHLPANSAGWAGIVAQFSLAIATREGRLYATWSGERLSRAIEACEGVVALSPQGQLLGLLLFEVTEQAAELSFPWTKHADHALMRELAEAALQVLRAEHPQAHGYRAERQLLPGSVDPSGMEAAGFACHWRQRMSMELAGWHAQVVLPPGYRLAPWHINYLDDVARVVYRANQGTLDADLYAPFFGGSPEKSRKGLLVILVGRYGPIHLNATLCAFQGETLVGVNLVIDEGGGLASVVELSVLPEHQQRGLGRALMVGSMLALKAEHFERVELAVTKANARALRLYNSLGFTPAGDFPVCILPE
jgi:ribosomal protein S18 acetylase RimI-like enzyme